MTIRMKIAIIGTGIAGNVAARELCRDHDITVFEANDYVGGHTHTVDIELDGRHYAIDTGFIVYNDRTYPGFIRLIEELGVASQTTEMSFSVACPRSGLEYNGSDLNGLFAQRRNLIRPSFLGMIRDILRFNREAVALLQQDIATLTLGEYLQRHAYSDAFINQYLVPMGAAIWSAEPAAILEFPAQFFVRFFNHHGLLSINDRPQWRVIKGGSRGYVEPLIAGFRDRIRLRTPVRQLIRHAGHVELRCAGVAPETFDCVFIATHSDQALGMLADPSVHEQAMLSAIPYQHNDVVLHTDERLLPRRRRAWAAWNYHLSQDAQRPAAVTYHMNTLQGIESRHQFLVTLNADDRIDPSRVLGRYVYHHPVFLPGSVQAQARLETVNGQRRTFFCGAYWRNGFHEDGVQSALTAVRHFKEWLANEQLPVRRVG
jgi:uncharacterized protein